MCSLICAGIDGWVNNREAGDLRRNRAQYDVTVMTRVSYHKAVRDVKRNQAELRKTKLANRAASLDNKYILYEVKKLSESKSPMPTQVDGFNEDIDIANCFADKYRNLFNSV